MPAALFLRRLHLYLGLVLLPWMFMYGVSSIPFAHGQYFQKRDAASGRPLWTVRTQRPYDKPVPDDPVAQRAFARALLQEAGVAGPNFGFYRPNRQTFQASAFSFRKSTRVVYALDRRTITVEDRRFRFDQFLTGMHARGGFEQDGLLTKSWGVLVDLVGVAFVLWVATGIYMWWGLPSQRRWGWVALLAGAGSFLLFALRL
jgi:hypothetical protein